MKDLRHLLALAVGASVMLAGCGGTQRIDELERSNAGLHQRVEELQQDKTALEQTNTRLRDRLEAESQARAESARDLQRLRGEMDNITTRLDDYRNIVLPADLDEALRSLAARYPDLMMYDPQRGMVQFASDFTFALGSDQLRDQAMQSLDRLAEVLTSDFAGEFEVRVVGHTDNVPIGNPATRAKHPTNMHLSVHRAINVRRALVDQGVPPYRVSVAGWGDQRPVVPNDSSRGAEANRRVEIFILPMSPSDVPPGTIEMGEPPTQAEIDTEEPMK